MLSSLSYFQSLRCAKSQSRIGDIDAVREEIANNLNMLVAGTPLHSPFQAEILVFVTFTHILYFYTILNEEIQSIDCLRVWPL